MNNLYTDNNFNYFQAHFLSINCLLRIERNWTRTGLTAQRIFCFSSYVFTFIFSRGRLAYGQYGLLQITVVTRHLSAPHHMVSHTQVPCRLLA